MLLTVFDDIRELIKTLLDKFSWANIFSLFAGIAVGFMMCFFIYLVIVLSSLKKNQKAYQETKPEISDEDLKRLIRSSTNKYYEESSSLPINRKIDDIKDISWELINDIAKLYYPESVHPIFELSIDEFLELNHYITNRVDSLFKGKVLKNFKRVKISQILKLIDLKKKIDENKMMKAAKKANVSGFYQAAMSVLNVFNPGYWVKKLMINTTINIGTNKIAKTLIEIVGEETIKVYSKNVFNKEVSIESEVDKTIKEIEQGLDSNI